ncbi:putative transcription factor SOX-14 isoform X2 [Micropterus dolomieu]|uniref:putative transcription factor SOX-14 isoform X2 n=1 Tax=Micropterus dolomieu TaxID=147949 RepID=UPI001E8ECA5F|nr:putative transcription factor SOX-14 isoform X2 [Micropterus dolomieu]
MSSVRTNRREAYKTSANRMDNSGDFERAVEEMEWEDVISTLQVAIDELLGNAPNPPPCPLPVPDGLVGNDAHPQTVESLSGGYGGYFPLGAPPHTCEQPSPLMTPSGLNAGQAAPIIYQGALYDQSVMQSGHLGQYGYAPAVRHLEGTGQSLPPVGVLNGHLVYGTTADVFASSYFAAPPLNTSVSNKENQCDEFQPYVKKPPNAFMLFMKAQRPKVMAELKISGSVVVNTILGQRWKLLSNEEKAKYIEEAQKEKQLHSQRHPCWSSKENYGKKRRRKRNVFTPSVRASASKLREATQRAKKLCVTPVQTAVKEPSPSQRASMEPSLSHRAVMEPSLSHTAVMEPSLSHTAVMEPSLSHTAVMEPSLSHTAVMEPSLSHTAVMVLSPSQTAVMEPSILQTSVMEAPDTQAAVMQPTHVQAAVTLHVCDFCHLPHVYETYWLNSPTATASTVLIHPAGLTRCTD